MNDLGNLAEIGDRADLVVDCHHTDDRNVVEGGSEHIEVDPTGCVDANHAPTPGLDCMQHGVVLDSRTEGHAAALIERSKDGCVVCFGTTAREDHLARQAADHVGHIVAGFVDGLADLSRKAVRPGRVGELLAQEWQHGRDRLGAHWRAGSVIEIGVAVVHGVQATPTYSPPTVVVVEDGAVDGYTDSTYGDAFADIYDDWYPGISDVDTTVNLLDQLADEFTPLPVLELGVGTGRLAVPLAARGVHVVGLDASAAMLAKLAENDPARSVTTCFGDMVDDQPAGPFALVFVAYNTFFNLLSEERQRACFAAVAERLVPGGAFVIEAFVPEPQPGSSVTVRSMTVDAVVLSVTTHDPVAQTAQGQYISITGTGGVRMRPWAIRYATVEQLDTMARDSGFRLAERWEDAERAPFNADSPRHVTVYRTIHSTVRPEAGATS